MSYAASYADPVVAYFGGRKHIVLGITETGAGASDEAVLTGVPVHGRIVSYRAKLTSGSGATINPKVGRAASFAASTLDHIASATATAAFINEQSAIAYYAPTGTLYLHSSVNAGSDNAISTEITILEGAQ